ncbi:HAD-IB family hydrolase [Pseudonocardia sp. CA-107938]|uniref:HAD-IB family hydrolase n=1 Tax=Pseudonocardia sp. CA-107938 TaxID=3240021 RepID=UPI003D8C8FDF
MSPETWDEARLVAEVAAGPHGPQIGAFFDFDGTLIDGFSLSAFAKHHLRSGHVTPTDAGRMLLLGLRGVTTEEDFEEFFVAGMRAWAGRSEDELAELGERLFVQGIAGSLYPEAWRLVEAHRRAGHTVVLASSATRFQVEPAARAMGVEHVLVTPVEIENGVATGRPGGPPLWRAGKAAAVTAFAAAHGIDLERSFAYSNGTEDVPFLSTVGVSRPLNPEPGLAAVAEERGWPVVRFTSRGRSGALRRAVRTVAGVGGMLGGFGAGAVLGLLNGSRREGIDLGIALAGDLGSALAGVELDVRGAEHLNARPAVFVFNHQSQLDVLVLAKLLRGGFTGVAKKEAANTPGFGPIFRYADMAFVDRGNTSQAKAALAPAVERLRDGISLVMAPEGTRSPTPALGPFKKGAFHVAMQAGVPIVPVVIRNAGELMWRGASTIREGTVQVAVLPPVPTDGWRTADIDEHVAEVRGMFLDTLADWDGGERGGKVTVTPGPSGPVPVAPQWRTSTEMSAAETAIWRAEAADERLRANVTLLELLDHAPEWERFVAAHEWASRMVPRIRQRVVEPAFGVGAPTWVTVDALDLDLHVSRIRLPAPGTERQLLDAVTAFAEPPLPRNRPLWRAALVEGLAGDAAAYVVTTHHSVTDGMGVVQLMSLLHSRTAEHDPERPEPPAPIPPPSPSPSELLVEQVGEVARSVPALLEGLPRTLSRPLSAVARSASAARSLGDVVVGPAGGSPLLAGRGGTWHLETLDIDHDALRAGARAAGGSVNDGFLAGVLGALRHYHQELGAVDVESVPIGLPLGLRPEDDPQAGRWTAARFDGPLQLVDAADRVRAVRRFVLGARAGGSDAGGALGPALAWVPGPVLGALSGRLSAGNDVQAAPVPGIGHAAFIAGSRITRMYPFGALTGCGATITMVVHEGVCCVGLNLDREAVTAPEVFVAGMVAALAEVSALA